MKYIFEVFRYGGLGVELWPSPLKVNVLLFNAEREICATFWEIEQYYFRQESCAIAKMTAQCTLYMGALKFLDSLTTPMATIPNIFSWAFVPFDSVNVPIKF